MPLDGETDMQAAPKLKTRHGRTLIYDDDSTLLDFASKPFLGFDTDTRISLACQDALERFGYTALPFGQFHVTTFNKVLRTLQLCYSTNMQSVLLEAVHLLTTNQLLHTPFSLHKQPHFIIDPLFHKIYPQLCNEISHFFSYTNLSFSHLEKMKIEFSKTIHQKHQPIALGFSLPPTGPIPNIDALSKLAKTHDGFLFLDDTYGLSLMGQQGEGYVLHTLGKWPPHVFIAGSLSQDINLPLCILGAAHPEDTLTISKHTAKQNQAAPNTAWHAAMLHTFAEIYLSGEIISRHKQLQSNLEAFDAVLGYYSPNAYSPLPYRYIYTQGAYHKQAITKQLHSEGFIVNPTPKHQGDDFIKISLSAIHTIDQVKTLANSLLALLSSSHTLHLDELISLER